MLPVPEYIRQPPVYFHMRILVGSGMHLTPRLATARGITHVINCAYDEDSPVWFRTAYPSRYVCLNAHDTPYHNILDWFPMFERTMHAFLREGLGTVFVHCQAGINRSAFLSLAYVCKNFQMEPTQLMAVVKKQRPCMFQNSIYSNQVREFINGCVSGAQNTRHAIVNDGNRDAGLRAPGDGADTSREDRDTGGTAM